MTQNVQLLVQNGMHRKNWQTHEYFTTPGSIYAAVEHGETLSTEKLAIALTPYLPQEGNSVVYGLDFNVTPENVLIRNFITTSLAVRDQVREVLLALKVPEVVMIEQNIEALRRMYPPVIHGWGRIEGTSWAAKVRRTTAIYPRETPFASPYLSTETIHALASYNHYLILAPYQPDTKRLHTLIKILGPKVSLHIILDAMRGNDHMHDQGLVHNDINDTNIDANEVNGRWYGVLTDLEGSFKIGAAREALTAIDMAEEVYLGPEHKIFDIARDIFAWGMTIMAVLGKKSRIGSRKFFQEKALDERVEDMIERILKEEGFPQFIPLIQDMTTPERDKRQSLKPFIARLEKLIAEMK